MLSLQTTDRLTSIIQTKDLRNKSRRVSSLRGNLLSKLGLIDSKIKNKELFLHSHAIQRIKERLGWDVVEVPKLLESIYFSPFKFEIGLLPEGKGRNRRVGVFSKELNLFFAAESHPKHEVIFKTVFIPTSRETRGNFSKKRKEFHEYYKSLLNSDKELDYRKDSDISRVVNEVIKNLSMIKGEKVCDHLIKFSSPMTRIQMELPKTLIYDVYNSGDGVRGVQGFLYRKFCQLKKEIWNELMVSGFNIQIKGKNVIFSCQRSNRSTYVPFEDIKPLIETNNLENLRNFIKVKLR